MKGRNSNAVIIFIGALLIVIFAVGFALDRNPDQFMRKYRYDFALEQFRVFCSQVWIPAGIIGIPLFLISLTVSLIREKKEKENE